MCIFFEVLSQLKGAEGGRGPGGRKPHTQNKKRSALLSFHDLLLVRPLRKVG